MYYVFILSISDPLEAAGMRVYLYPKGLYLDSYKMLFQDTALWRSYWNTLIYVVADTGLMIVVCSLCAYPLTCSRLIGRKLVTVFLLIPMYFGGGLIPTYLVMKDYGLINSIWSMILPWAVSSYYVIIMKNYFRSISPSLEEAAIIDGAGDLQILLRIILPISLPFTMTFLLFYAVERWNEWWNAYLYINEKSLYPLQIYLREVLINMNNQLSLMAQITSGKKIPAQSVQMGTIVITALPILCVYPFVQKYFVKGVMIGSIKE